MRITGIVILITLKIMNTENRMLPLNYETIEPKNEDGVEPFKINKGNLREKVIGKKPNDDKDNEEYVVEFERKLYKEKSKKPCAIVVLSNIQNPTMQTLLRKYRYDANGILIPSSVKYFIKMPQGLRASPVLVPLNDKAFSPLGGFIRYYKEVPPIPQSW